jgi:hypothetical protein
MDRSDADRAKLGRVVARHRQVAFDRYCLLGGETIHPRFRWLDGPFSHILTLDAGYE